MKLKTFSYKQKQRICSRIILAKNTKEDSLGLKQMITKGKNMKKQRAPMKASV